MLTAFMYVIWFHTLGGRHHYPHFTDIHTEAQQAKRLVHDYKTAKGRAGPSDSKSHILSSKLCWPRIKWNVLEEENSLARVFRDLVPGASLAADLLCHLSKSSCFSGPPHPILLALLTCPKLKDKSRISILRANSLGALKRTWSYP